MSEVSKFIPMEGNGENMGCNSFGNNGVVENGNGNNVTNEENIKTTMETVENGGVGNEDSTFKVCGTSNNLPAKQSFWSKVKGILFYEIKVELTPYQQKIEDEINEFLHKEITWQGIKNFFFKGKKGQVE